MNEEHPAIKLLNSIGIDVCLDDNDTPGSEAAILTKDEIIEFYYAIRKDADEPENGDVITKVRVSNGKNL